MATLLHEDGAVWLDETGTEMHDEFGAPTVTVTATNALMLEDGGYLLKEDGDALLREYTASVTAILSLEDGFFALLESGDRILLESNAAAIVGTVNVAVRGLTHPIKVRGLTT